MNSQFRIRGRTAKPPSRSMAGFTLVEIMVVVAILAVLVLFAAGAVSRGIESARISRSSGNLRQLAEANILYAADNGQFVPADDKRNLRRWHGARTSASAAFDPGRGLLAPYLGSARALTPCPILEAMPAMRGGFEEGTGGYGYNAQYIGGKPGMQYDRQTGLRISESPFNVPDLARTVMFATTAYALSDGIQEYPYCEPPFWDFGNGPSGSRPSPTVHFRARGKALVAWGDGSVTSEPKRDRPAGANPHGGDPNAADLGWFGPDEENGYWNPRRSPMATF